MDAIFDVHHWDDIKTKLLVKYPVLTKADLQWRYNSRDALIEMIADKLGMTFKDLRLEIDGM